MNITFIPRKSPVFEELKAKVNAYFEDRGISKNANWEAHLNILFAFSLTYIPYGLILSGKFNIWVMWLLSAIMGLGMAAIGLGVMHDANHGAYSKSKWVNKLLGSCLNLLGSHRYIWNIRHNILHHTFTNVYDLDDDIAKIWLLRLSPEQKRHWYHRFQHFYVIFVYMNYTLSWLFYHDNIHLIKYFKTMGYGEKSGDFINIHWSKIVEIYAWKLFSLFYMIGIPYLLLDLSLWQAILGFLTAHWAMGLVVGVIFQINHMIDGTAHGIPDKNGKINDNWAEHEIKCSYNFSTDNKFFTWYLGGLNFQIEHHLFKTISSVHYLKLKPIFKEVLEKHGYTYNDCGSWGEAIRRHLFYLKEMGRVD